MIMVSRKDLHIMQAAAKTPGVDYSVFVAEEDEGAVVVGEAEIGCGIRHAYHLGVLQE